MPSLQQKLQTKLSQRLIITPQLQQAIRLLQLNRLDLQEELRQELVENPALEEATTRLEQADHKDEAETPEREVTAGTEAERAADDFDFTSYFRDLEDSYRPIRGSMEFRSEDLPTIEQVLSSTSQLPDHLQWQLEMSDLQGAPREIGEAIIGNLDERGYLQASPEEIAGMAPDGVTWAVDNVESVLHQVQRFDPVGVASQDLRECLLIQLDMAGLAESPAATVVREHLSLLEARRFDKLMKAIGATDAELDQILDVIRHLDPSPGEKYNPQPTKYITPDVYVIKDGDDYRVLLNEDGLPRLRISPSYRRLLSQLTKVDASDAKAQDFVKDKVRAAFRLIRSLEERQRTIGKVANSIVTFQRPFLDFGIEQIKPLVLRDVAEDIGMHESTVSRVVNQKYMHTPRGLFEMRFFFHSSISSDEGSAISSLTVKDRIKKMVQEENPAKTLSDQAIAETLRKDGLRIARRTVAKYREELRIPPSTQRRKRR
ncbi:MAG: RNA polymerase factor sigma-54 [Acidobacteriota bacterium]|nr:RNA polymerase factor sigma-54 [Acidobacteriota bacterium]